MGGNGDDVDLVFFASYRHDEIFPNNNNNNNNMCSFNDTVKPCADTSQITNHTDWVWLYKS